jgi:phage tail-like protein
MAEFTVKLQRFDPYQNFKFRVKWDGRYVAGISKVSALKRSIEIIEHREGGDASSSRRSPGRTKFEAITLERGITQDNDFERWANAVPMPRPSQSTELSPKNYRKNVTIEVYNSNSDLVITYKLLQCWVSEYQAFTELDGNSVVVEMLKLENEGWERSQVHTNPAESA